MGGLFSKKRPSNSDEPAKKKKKKKGGRVTSHDQAVLDLKVQRDKLVQYKKNLNKVLDKENESIKTLLVQKKRKQALLILKKKKLQENLIEKTEAQLMNVEQMIGSVEFTQMESKILEGLKAGNDVLKELHSQMSLDEIDKIMLDTEEAMEYQNEIDEALGQSLTPEDEDEIMAELAELEKEDADDLKTKMDEVKAPVHEIEEEEPVIDEIVPEKKIAVEEKEEEEEEAESESDDDDFEAVKKQRESVLA